MTLSRIDVAAGDGTPLAVWVQGTGPALVMVHGSLADHTTFDPFVAVLGERLTTFAMDRRGFGATPDTEDYAIETDFADVASVVDAVADRTGGPVALWGHSYGAGCAMGAAARSRNISHLIVYEPFLGGHYPAGSIDMIEAALARGDNDAAAVALLVDVLRLSESEVKAFRDSPLWPTRVAAAPTIPRECRAERDWVYRPGQCELITAQPLVLQGADSTPAVIATTRLAAAALPGAQVRVLDGHGHFAHKTDPELVSDIVWEFMSARASGDSPAAE